MKIKGGIQAGENHVSMFFKVNPLGADVHFNGQRWEGPPYICEADDEKGYIEVELLDGRGLPKLHPNTEGEMVIQRTRLFGNVEFKGPRL